MNNLLKSALNYISSEFRKDTAKMLVYTGTIGWILSAGAQMMGILFNSKLSNKQKSFLLPQEFWDAFTNIGLFFVLTLSAKNVAGKMFSTGKLAPKSVKNFLENNKELYGSKVGKIDFNLNDVAKNNSLFPKDAYETYKNFGTTLVTLGSGIVATNILTPYIRNKNASFAQNRYMKYKNINQYQQNTNNLKI